MADEDEPVTEEERKRRALLLGQAIADRYSPDRLSKVVVEQAGRGQHLDLATRMEMERKVGGNFADVRVFRGPFAEAITKQHRADAVTVANTGMILVREGPRSDPSTALGKALLAHELTHVRQAQTGMHFALEGGQSQGAPHEQEAEAVEASVHADATGQGGGGGGKPGGKHGAGDLKKKIRERVFAMIAEQERLQRERNGHG
jgi:hypothetical protein